MTGWRPLRKQRIHLRFWTNLLLAAAMVFGASALRADEMNCDLSGYRPQPGLTAAVQRNQLTLSWTGTNSDEVRASFAIDNGAPVVRELAIRRAGAAWKILGQDLVPEFRVTSGVRRMSEQQAAPLRALGVAITDEVVEKNKWYAFWDAPLEVPGTRPGETTPRDIGLPRKPEEIRRAAATFQSASCRVRTNGERIEVTFPGLAMGIFSGELGFTVYRGTNLLRMEAIAKTNEPSVAYKYEAGLKGFAMQAMPQVTWRDTGGHGQQYRFGGVTNSTVVPVRAQNRILIATGSAGSLAAFPPPHSFFFTREIDTNLGYVWYRKDADQRYAIGIRQPDHEDVEQYRPNFALYNAPPGTWQHMAVYFFASADAAEAARQSVLAFTHGDTFKPLPGYKTFVNHFHLGFTDRLRESGSLDTPLPDLAAMKALGLKLARVPGPDEDWSPILKTLRDGDFFATTGEVLITNYAVTGSGASATVNADVEWTFPLEFAEMVWGDGKKIDRKIVPATDLPAFGKKHFAIPFDATGKSWVRFAVWDSAGNGAFAQPVWVSR
jgi:hypothetical protein